MEMVRAHLDPMGLIRGCVGGKVSPWFSWILSPPHLSEFWYTPFQQKWGATRMTKSYNCWKIEKEKIDYSQD